MSTIIRRDGHIDIARLFRHALHDDSGILPSQHADPHENETGEHRLAVAVLEATIHDIRLGKCIEVTEQWMNRCVNEDGDYSFAMCAEALNVDEGYLKRLIRKEIVKIRPKDDLRRCKKDHIIDETNASRSIKNGVLYFRCNICHNDSNRASRDKKNGQRVNVGGRPRKYV